MSFMVSMYTFSIPCSCNDVNIGNYHDICFLPCFWDVSLCFVFSVPRG